MQKILIVQSPYYEEISELLLEGVIEELVKHKNVVFEVVDVMGALEIPAAIAMANKSKEYDGFIALGCVIRGQTSHYDYVCQESANGLNLLAINELIPIANGILTVENKDQAIARADKSQKNKGGYAAKACLSMMKIKKKFS